MRIGRARARPLSFVLQRGRRCGTLTVADHAGSAFRHAIDAAAEIACLLQA